MMTRASDSVIGCAAEVNVLAKPVTVAKAHEKRRRRYFIKARSIQGVAVGCRRGEEKSCDKVKADG